MNATPPKNPLPNPMEHPDEQQPDGSDGSPKFGRLLIVLAIAVMMIVGITLGSQAYFS
ncbi:hypothetical protein IMCC9480_3784 [Oxalobacteraceae bacterium IMCC9480]|jgi:hypothetical protein|nr:hypothetical protein IMCC9480_3784 [Oxalobacteraceae bacterium IMCC9480]NDP60166.1 hypothetical protein [Oxalobacteraceae bacterium]